ncbi:3-oxoacyl-ACP reductase FabG [Thiocapsa marina]|uniref:3-oxoacyl-[acyl-carrier-protein] reductase n=1 Tax=Thiocapsa marina 5811 TaxID=768671 RepID=F9UFU2_9GAMM|nr:3-oxoacyl-ACP reductase FabG [Thiocapsa marina]EGV16966.1 3-oxoacyl-(acyl-carrier-protein) reductase [Thiocapsa marina 5811]
MLNDEIALVTGASRGIGRSIAMALAEQGAAVAGTATTAAGARSIEDALTQAGYRGIGVVMDVSDQASVDAAMTQITERLGAPGILVNNAGITRDNLLMRMKDEEWDAVIETNLSSLYRVTKACLRAMTKARKGRIINIASVVGSMGNAGQTNYAAAKAGMMGFTKALAREVGSRAITVNCVAPGFIDTDMTRDLPDAQRQSLIGSIPLARLGHPEEIAGSVVFLASPAAAYITGETLHVNGGMHMA